MTEPTPSSIDEGLRLLIAFIDDTLVPSYDDKTVASILIEFALLTPRTVLGMASPSTPEAYQGLREALTTQMRREADALSVQEPIDDMLKAKAVFDELFSALDAQKTVH